MIAKITGIMCYCAELFSLNLTPLFGLKLLVSCFCFSTDLLWLTLRLRMTVYSTRERKTSNMQARSQTSMAVTALDTGIRALVEMERRIKRKL